MGGDGGEGREIKRKERERRCTQVGGQIIAYRSSTSDSKQVTAELSSSVIGGSRLIVWNDRKAGMEAERTVYISTATKVCRQLTSVAR